MISVTEVNRQRAKCGWKPVGPVKATPAAPVTTIPLRLPILLPVVIVSEANRRDHWAAAHKRAKQQRSNVACSLMKFSSQLQAIPRPWRITLTSLTNSGQRAMDTDNLGRALKAVRDEIALVLGIDDGDTAAAAWEYFEGMGPGGVLLEIGTMD